MIPVVLAAVAAYFLARDDELATGRAAVEKILRTHRDIPAAMRHPTLGLIDFRWGNARKGFCHIQQRAAARLAKFADGMTPERITYRIPEILLRGKIHNEGPRKVIFTHEGMRVTLAKDYDGKPSAHWVLSAYDLDPKKKGNR